MWKKKKYSPQWKNNGANNDAALLRIVKEEIVLFNRGCHDFLLNNGYAKRICILVSLVDDSNLH